MLTDCAGKCSNGQLSEDERAELVRLRNETRRDHHNTETR